MYRYEKILVYLNAQDEERTVLEIAGKITHMAKSAKLTFTHFCEIAEIPQEVKHKYPWLMDPLGKAVEERVAEQVAAHFKGYAETEVKTHIGEGHAIYKILEKARDEDIDLIVVGGNTMNGDLPVRLARKAPCSVMVVPEEAPTKLEKMLVTVDFSKYSEYSIDVASAFAKAQELPSIDALHVSLLPEGRSRGILSEIDYVQLNEPFFRNKLNEFVSGLDSKGVEVVPHVAHGYSVNCSVKDYASENGIDLIVTGCRGKDALSALLLGSNAESLVETSAVPVVAVKEKGTGRSYLDQLLGIGG